MPEIMRAPRSQLRRSSSGFVRGAGGRPMVSRGGGRSSRGVDGRGPTLVPPKAGRGRAVPAHKIANGRAGPGRGHPAAGRVHPGRGGPAGRPAFKPRNSLLRAVATRRIKPKTSVKLLICSANMGNAQPDPGSINQWIPSDGLISLVVKDPPKFPVSFSAEPTEAELESMEKRSSNVDLKGENNEPEFLAFLEQHADSEFASHDDAYEAFLASQHEKVHINESQEDNVTVSNLPVEDDYEAFLQNNASVTSLHAFDYNTPVVVDNADDGDDYEAFLAKQAASAEIADTFDYNTPIVVNDAPSADDDYEAFLAKQTQEASDPLNASVASDMMSTGSKSNTKGSIRSDRTSTTSTTRESSSTSSQSQASDTKKIDPHEQFDIVILGMQEATFETEGGGTSDDDLDLGASDDDSSLSSEEEDLVESLEEAVITETDESITTEEIETEDGKKKKTLTNRMFGATKKVGKATLKVSSKTAKVTLKVGKGTLKAGGKAMEAGKAAKQLTMAKDHTNRHVDTAQKESSSTSWSDTRTLHYLFEKQLPSYTRSLSYQLGQMRLVIYTKTSKALEVELISVKHEPTGKHGLANKGGIVSEILVNKTTRLSFLTAHLEAHEGHDKFIRRCTSFKWILEGTKSKYTPYRYDASIANHYMFAMGDLNFRTKLLGVEAGSEEHIKKCHELAAQKDWKTLNERDELSRALREKKCLVGFRTPYCGFDPTFKVARSKGYDYNVKRSPSYTDRILFKTADQLDHAVDTFLYEPVPRFVTSDHKPIRGAFEVKLNEQIRLPSAIGAPNLELHILVSSLECTINAPEYRKTRASGDEKKSPNPFVSFVSTPADAIRLSKKKKGTMKKLAKSTTKTLGYGSSFSRSAWPGTPSLDHTFEPKWEDDVSFSIRTHREDGTEIDLTGSMLHISCFDDRDDYKLIGAFTLNLARLITVSRADDKKSSSETSQSSNGGADSNVKGWSYDESKKPSKAMKALINKELIAEDEWLSRPDYEKTLKKKTKDKLEKLNPFTFKLNERLTESGKQFGRVKCTIDAFWMAERRNSMLED